MGTDINSWVEIKKQGKWVEANDVDVFNYRAYSMFAFIAGIRNDAECEPIADYRGLPNDSEYLNQPYKHAYKSNPMSGEDIPIEQQETNKHNIEEDDNAFGYTWVTLKELIDFDYDKTFENRLISKVVKSNDGNFVMGGAAFRETVKEGEGTVMSYKDFLSDSYFADLETLKQIDENPEDIRIIFYFD